jgi:hypothetical protein
VYSVAASALLFLDSAKADEGRGTMPQGLPARIFVLIFMALMGSSTARSQEFLEPPNYPTGAAPVVLASGDFNGDGHPDLVTGSDVGAGSISVLLNNGDGTFQPHRDYASCNRASDIAVGDFNRDSKLDVAVLTGNGLCIQLGNGDGTFRAGTNFPAAGIPTYFGMADFNSDGKLDFVVAETGSQLDLFLGNGDGSFSAGNRYAVSPTAHDLTAADFNGDGHPDIAISIYFAPPDEPGGVDVFLGNGDGTFQPRRHYPAGSLSTSVAAADFNGDGKVDLGVANESVAVKILLGNGDGSFQAPSYSQHFFAPQLQTADLNGDGKADLFTGLGSVLLGNGDGTLQSGVANAYIVYQGQAVTADFNGDGIPDLAVTDSNADPSYAVVYVLIGNGNGSFKTRAGYAIGQLPSAAAVGDFNRDGRTDIVASSGGNSNGKVTLLLGSTFGSFIPAGSFDVGKTPLKIVSADFNRDGLLDVATSDSSGATVSILIGNADATFQTNVDYATGPQPYGIAAADLNNDGKLDIVTANGSGTVSVLLGNGDGSFQPHFDIDAGIGANGIATGDLNADGSIDVAVGNVDSSANTISVLFGHGDGTFNAPTLITVGGGPKELLITDLNHDGKLDLAVADRYDGLTNDNVSILLGNGNGTFQPEIKYPVTNVPITITTADFNGDGNPDLAVNGAYASVLWGNGDGTFQPARDYAIGGTEFMLAANLNGDRAPDLAFVETPDAFVSVLLNTGGSFVTASSNPNPSKQGQAVTLSATVAGSLQGASVPTGTVTFKDGGKKLATVTLGPGGKAKFTTSTLSAGTHKITSSYSGDSTYNPNTGHVITQVVQ